MKTNGFARLISFALLLTCMVWSCEKKETPIPGPTGGNTGTGTGSTGGTGTTTPTPSPTTGTATFFTKEDLGVGSISVSVDGKAEGTISHYHSNGVDCGQGDVNVTKAAGTYSFKATGGTLTWTGTITIKNGSCQAQELVKSSGSNSGGTTAQGQVTFWTAQTTGWSTIDVSVGGSYVGTIKGYYTSAPSCGAASGVTVTKPPGTYPFTAQSDIGEKWSGDITVSANGCATRQLTFSSTTTPPGGTGSGSITCDWTSATQCAKIVAKKGTRCGDPTSLEVNITNGCTVPVKFYVCIQRSDGTWSGSPDGTFDAGTGPGKTSSWYDCKTTNQYKFGAVVASTYAKNKCAYPKCN